MENMYAFLKVFASEIWLRLKYSGATCLASDIQTIADTLVQELLRKFIDRFSLPDF
jgi:hypothetical protein